MAPVDYVLVYDESELSLAAARESFDAAMLDDGLLVERERVGELVFVKVTAPFARLALQAERCKLEVPLKGCDIKPPERNFLRSIWNVFATDDEVDFVSAPFQMTKRHLYVGSENEETFFRVASRTFLVHQILINLDITLRMHSNEESNSDADHENLKKKGLLYLLMKRAYKDAFVVHEASADDPVLLKRRQQHPEEYEAFVRAGAVATNHPYSFPTSKLHEDARRELNETWTRFFKFQPLWKVRNYFGEKIAFYFAWQGTYITLLWLPAIVGLFVFVYGFVTSLQSSQRSVACSPWTRSTTAAPLGALNLTGHENGTLVDASCGFVSSLRVAMADLSLMMKRSFDNVFSALFAAAICLWGSLFFEVWKRNRNTLAYQWDCENYKLAAEPDRPEFFGTTQQADPITGELSMIYPQLARTQKFLVSALVAAVMIGIVFVSVFAVIAYKVVMRARYNCPSSGATTVATAGEAEGHPAWCLLATTVVPSVLNAISIMLLGKVYEKMARRLTHWENHRTQSEFNDALIVKLFAFQFANTYTSLFYIAFMRPESNVVVAVAAACRSRRVQGFQRNGLFGWGERYKDTCSQGTCLSLLSFQVLVLMLFKPIPKLFKDLALPWLKRQWRRAKVAPAGDDAAGDTGSHHLQREYFKYPVGEFTLGEYTEKVIQYGYIVMFAASFPLAPLLALVINQLDLRLDAKRLLWWNRRPVAFIASDIGMWQSIVRFVSFCGVVSNAFIVAVTSNFCSDLFSPQPCSLGKRLAIVIAFEHVVLTAMYLISVSIPDDPSAIRLARRRERYQVPRILETGITGAAHVDGQLAERTDSACSLRFAASGSHATAAADDPRRTNGHAATRNQKARRSAPDRLSSEDLPNTPKHARPHPSQ